MKTVSIEKIEAAEALPDAWDALASSPFQRRPFLVHCERYNPCAQRYYLLRDGAGVRAGAVVYTLGLDLLTFLGVKSPVRMHIAGVPCSVSSSGIIGDPAYRAELLRRLTGHEKGFLLCLNLDAPPPGPSLIPGRTWPSVEIENAFSSWETYRKSLRSHYRRRLAATEKAARSMDIRIVSCPDRFDGELYAMYEAVYCRSRGKLEKLTLDFFRNLPPEFMLTTYAAGGAMYGWSITVADPGGTFCFFLGGQNYSRDPSRLYLVKLMTVVRQGIESGAARIDLGQSAEIPKMRFGGRLREKHLAAWHTSAVVRSAVRMGRGLLSYNRRFPATSCFTERRL